MRTKKTRIETPWGTMPARLYVEKRNNIRYSIGSKEAIMRMPSSLIYDVETQFEKFSQWVHKQLEEKEAVRERFFRESYKDGDELHICDTSYKLHFVLSDDTSIRKVKISGQDVYIYASNMDDLPHNTIQKLFSKLFVKRYLPIISQRVHALNEQHFQKEVRKVSMRHTVSRWGSCSSDGNIMLSSRLLLVPSDVRDYVIIHELAHLIEMNHQAAFWQLVEHAMPDYQKHVLWLKKNRGIDF